MSFVHLHVHDQYSQLDGFGTAKEYVERAKFLNQDALASTNHGNIDGLIKFQKECIKGGVKPLLGCELYVVDDISNKESTRRHMTILIKNEHGWKAICNLLTRANLEGFYRRPRVEYSWIKNLPDEQVNGLVVMSACLQSFLHDDSGYKLMTDLSKKTDVFLEVMPWPSKSQVEWNKKLLLFSDDHDIPLVATNDCHYIVPEDSKVQEVLLAIQRKVKWNDPNRWKFEHSGLHLRSQREMLRAFKAHKSLDEKIYKEAIENTLKVADLCNFQIPQMDISLPKTSLEIDDRSAIEILDDLVYAGVEERMEKLPQEYQDRIEDELDLIYDKKFERYFLIVYDFCKWCKDNDIMLAPGRGSVGGSLIAYFLGITEVDPMKYGLLFSRFISPDRNDFPDIDIDIQDDRREEAREYLERTYGKDYTCGISTFLTMKGRGVIRDVARVFDVPLSEVDKFTKIIQTGEHDHDIVKCAIETDEGRSFYLKYKEPCDIAMRLEGQIRGSGQHPAAIVISSSSINDDIRGNIAIRKGIRVSNWDMQDSEYMGLMKLDALRLGTLTVLSECKRLVYQNCTGDFIYHPESDCYFIGNKAFDWDDTCEDLGLFEYTKLVLDDHKVFKMLSEGKTAGVFQLSGYACTKVCKDMGINSFDDIVAVLALARPGPLNSGMTDNYISGKKHGWKESKYKKYHEIVKDTFGVLVYQEQVMQVFTDMAGMSGGMADKIRKVIGKKREASEFEPYRIQFLEGCQNQKESFNEKEANEFWKGLLEWAHYGFNKAHAVEYAMISFWTAWMKYYHPTEYLAAFLTYGEKTQRDNLLKEYPDVKIATPKVGYSDAIRWVAHDGFLFMPFIQVKGVGETQAKKCMDMKKAKRKGFFDIPNSAGGTKIDSLLDEIKAFDPDPNIRPNDLNKYFECDIGDVCFNDEPVNYLRRRR